MKSHTTDNFPEHISLGKSAWDEAKCTGVHGYPHADLCI